MADEVVVGNRAGRDGPGSARLPTVASPFSALRARPGHGRPGRSERRERGAVTAEAAVVMPLLLAVTMALVWLVALATTHMRVVDAARETARSASRGESDAVSVGLGRRVAPDGARFEVSRGAETVTVRVVAEVGGPGGLLAFLPPVPVSAEAVAAQEPAAGQDVG